MLRPMTKAPAEMIPSSSALFSSGVSNIQACSRSTAPSPKGFSRLWLGPATYPSTETEMSHTTLLPMDPPCRSPNLVPARRGQGGFAFLARLFLPGLGASRGSVSSFGLWLSAGQATWCGGCGSGPHRPGVLLGPDLGGVVDLGSGAHHDRPHRQVVAVVGRHRSLRPRGQRADAPTMAALHEVVRAGMARDMERPHHQPDHHRTDRRRAGTPGGARPNPMSIVTTIGVGLAGALVGGLIAGLIGAGWLIAIILEVALAALLVYFLTSRRTVA